MEFPALPCPWLLCFSRFPCPGPTVLRLFDPAQDQKVLECRALLHLIPPPTMRAWWSCLGLFCCLSPNSTLPWLYGYVLLLHRTRPDPSFSIGSLVTSQQGPSILHLSLLGVGSGWINFSRAAFFANEKKEDQKRVFFGVTLPEFLISSPVRARSTFSELWQGHFLCCLSVAHVG